MFHLATFIFLRFERKISNFAFKKQLPKCLQNFQSFTSFQGNQLIAVNTIIMGNYPLQSAAASLFVSSLDLFFFMEFKADVIKISDSRTTVDVLISIIIRKSFLESSHGQIIWEDNIFINSQHHVCSFIYIYIYIYN